MHPATRAVVGVRFDMFVFDIIHQGKNEVLGKFLNVELQRNNIYGYDYAGEAVGGGGSSAAAVAQAVTRVEAALKLVRRGVGGGGSGSSADEMEGTDGGEEGVDDEARVCVCVCVCRCV